MDLEERKRKAKELLLKSKEEAERKGRELWENLPPFNGDQFKVPRLPIPLTQYHIDKLVKAGAIPKSELVDQRWYIGDFRNTNIAKWNADSDEFIYVRCKFGHYFNDECNHFENDNGFALFVPLREATEDEINNVINKLK